MNHSSLQQSKEVEVKYRLPDKAAAEQALLARGVSLGPAVRQDDQAFAPVGWTYQDKNVGVTFARIRTQDGVHTFTVKRPIENQFACLEYESEVSDPAALTEAIKLMNYAPTTRIVKTRRTGQLGEFVICLDEVEGLGAFLEVEQMADNDVDPKAIMASLNQFVDSLSIEAQPVHDGYDVLVHNG